MTLRNRGSSTMGKVIVVLFLLVLQGAQSLPANLLYPDDLDALTLPAGDEVSSPAMRLKVPIVFYGVSFKSLFVNSNGFVSFITEVPNFFNVEFPLDHSAIAPLYSNVDTTRSGTISYYATSDVDILERATTNIQEAFSNHIDFIVTSVVVVTWKNVGYYRNGSDKQNTFQIVIATNGTESFVEFLYPEDGIQWIQSQADEGRLPDARAQAGLVANDGRMFTLPGSGTDQIKNLVRLSNINLPGQFLYRVGNIQYEEHIEEPNMFTNDPTIRMNSENMEMPKSCLEAANQCHSNAKCRDINDGFCCECKRSYYGNGMQCIKKDVPLRVNGRVNGLLNNEPLDSLDLQSYIVMIDGRAYTAMSRIPTEIGHQIQTMQILGSTIAWLFAKSVQDASNGFQLTGGEFNHSATLVFPNSKVEIKQKFLGLDVFDQLKIETTVNGELPLLPQNAQIMVDEYSEVYSLTAHGVVQSSSTRQMKYKNDHDDWVIIPVGIEQSIVFRYCDYTDALPDMSWKLKVGSNFINYEETEQIMRYGISNKIGPLKDVDPCEEGRSTCTPNSSCVIEGDDYKCICNPGYQQIHRDGDPFCTDINECQRGLHDCDYNADCINEIGAFRCECHPGFEGNGHSCAHVRSCEGVVCPANSECVDKGVAISTCQCMEGFTGDGQACTAVASVSCNMVNNCSPYGYCSILPDSISYMCSCLNGYAGDGYTCYQVSTMKPSSTTPLYDSSEAEAVQPEDIYVMEICDDDDQGCYCPDHYTKVEGSVYCMRNMLSEVHTTEAATPKTCDVLKNCDAEAQCIKSPTDGTYRCFCNAGFEGDGYSCTLQEQSCATEDICHEDAMCDYKRDLDTYVCVCTTGYVGNGFECTSKAVCVHDDECGANEQCHLNLKTFKNQCKCKDGYESEADGKCVDPNEQDPLLCGPAGDMCHPDGECIANMMTDAPYCSCRSGFEGDGVSVCNKTPDTCDVVNNCGLHAACEYDQMIRSYKCKCSAGFEGDGLVCTPEMNCHVYPYMCDVHATCVTDSQRHYVCKCNPDYIGNGTSCTRAPKHDGNFLLLNQGMATLKIPFEVSKRVFGRPIQIKYNQIAVGLDVDCYAGRVYWSDIALRTIRSSSYNGTNKEDFIVKDLGSPEGIAIDWVSRNIYWTDSTRDTIEVANLDTKTRKVLFKTDLVNPRGIAVHPQRGKIFWTDWDREKPKIEWANMDGTDRAVFLDDADVQLPNNLAIDYFTEQLCYTDAELKKIECVSIDSRIKQTIAENCSYPFGIAVTEHHVYWSDWQTKKVERVYKPTMKRVPPLNIPLGGSGNKLYGLAVVPDQCPNLTNVCQYYKDQCPQNYLCLPDGKGSRRCVCGTNPNDRGHACNDIN